MTQRDYAFIGAAFFLSLALSLTVYGQHTERLLIMCALLLGGYSQYAAQDHRSGPIPIVLSYAAMVFVVAAIGVFWGRA